jgi:hypothetical protein
MSLQHRIQTGKEILMFLLQFSIVNERVRAGEGEGKMKGRRMGKRE